MEKGVLIKQTQSVLSSLVNLNLAGTQGKFGLKEMCAYQVIWHMSHLYFDSSISHEGHVLGDVIVLHLM